METTHIKEVKAPLHFKTRRSHDAVIFFLFFSMINYFLSSLGPYGRRISNTFLDLLLGLDAAFDVLDNLDLFFFDGFLLSYLYFHLLGIKHFPLASLFGIIGF